MDMTRKALIVPIAALATCVVCAVAASAQGRGRERRSGDQQQSAPSQPERRAVPRSREQAPRAPAPVQRQQQAPVTQFQNAPRAQGAQPRVQAAPRVAPERQGSYNAIPYRQQAPSQVSPQSREYSRGVAAPRTYQNQRAYSSGTYGYSRAYSRPLPHSSYYAPRFYYPRPLYRPYYAFQPRLRLGFGIYIGYPVAYPTWYDPYLSTSYTWYRPGISYGGVSFDIQPPDAEIYIDGNYVGVVQDFGPYAAPLTLPAGPHHVDLRAPGFGPMSFNITVVPRQVIPYQGTLPG